MVSEDSENRKLAAKDGLTAITSELLVYTLNYTVNHGLIPLTAQELVDMYPGAPDLQDLVSDKHIPRDPESAFEPYDEHLARQQMLAEIKAGVLLQGKLEMSTYNMFEASVFCLQDSH